VKARAANCPSCGGPVEFHVSSTLVTICDFCQCVVARTDKAVADLGKVSDLTLTVSPLCRGQTGRIRGKKFEIIGRVQYQHAAGGVWDEWYLLFSNGRWGWLADAQGKYFLTFEKRLARAVPEFDSLEPSMPVKLDSKSEFVVAEVGTATAIAAEGEIPWPFRPGAEQRYADLQGAGGTFATIDYSDGPPVVYSGREVSIDDLKLSDSGMAQPDGEKEVRVGALSLNCPQCGGALTLQAPDESKRVSCPNCSSLLDCSEGKLEYFQTLQAGRRHPVIPLGSTGTLDGVKYTVIGFLERFARYEGRDYPWTEYLLREGRGSYAWLVNNSRHWSLAKAVPVGDVRESGTYASYQGERFRLYDRGTATVRYVLGEFYWQVEAGEQASTADYIAPPRMLSVESSGSGNTREVNISLATYKTHEEIEKAFSVDELARSWGVGAIQPAPNASDILKLWACFGLLLVLLYFAISSVQSKTIDGGFFTLMLVLVSAVPVGFLLYKYQFEVNRWKDSDYSPYSSE
jgi:hypothetical protein